MVNVVLINKPQYNLNSFHQNSNLPVCARASEHKISNLDDGCNLKWICHQKIGAHHPGS